MKHLLSIAALAAFTLGASAQNLIIAATNLPGPGYAAWTNFVVRYNQASSMNKNVNVTGFNYLQTNVVAAVTNDAGQVVTPASTNVVEIHPRLTSAELLADFAKSPHCQRLLGEALGLYIRDRKAEILAQIEDNWWNGIK